MGVPDWWDWKRPDYDRVWQERIAKLEALRKEPERIPALLDYYRDHWTDFCSDWMVTFDPRAAAIGMPTTMPFLLFPKQEEFVNWVRDRYRARQDGLVEKSRDMGISWCCCAIAVCMLLFERGSVTGFGSRKEDLVDKIGDPDSLFWKIRLIIDTLPAEFRPKGYDKSKHAPHMRVLNLRNESSILGEAGDNIGRGGRASIYFVDEAAHVEHAEAVDAALSQTANTQIHVSTPNGEGNPFWQKRHSGQVPVFVFDWRDDPRKDAAWYERQKQRMTPVALAAEVDRDYSASVTNSFIPSPTVTTAMARGPGDVLAHAALPPIRIGLDVARFGDDRCVFSVRRGRALLKQVKWGKTDTVQTASRAKVLIQQWSRMGDIDQIAVDVIGLGAGVADMLRADFGEVVVDVNAALQMDNGEHYNLRAFMWDQMKDWLSTASIPNDQELRVSLTAVRYGYKGGALLLESKDDMKKRGIKSPDEADSLALTFAIPVTKRKAKPIPGNRVARYDVDPEMGL